jgi:hypothetical protein
MASGNYEYRIQLKDTAGGTFGTSIISAGGNVHVAKAGLPDKQPIYDKTGAVLANPLVPVRGFINFFVPVAIASVDLYIQAPGGQFKVALGVTPSGPNEIGLDTSKSEQWYKIPYSIADAVAGTEQATGFVVPDPAFFLDRLHGCGLDVTVVETAGAETINVGTAEANSAGGDSDGFIAGSSTATLGLVIGTNGTLFSTNAPATSTAIKAGNSNIVYVLVTASVAAKGFIYLPVRLG